MNAGVIYQIQHRAAQQLHIDQGAHRTFRAHLERAPGALNLPARLVGGTAHLARHVGLQQMRLVRGMLHLGEAEQQVDELACRLCPIPHGAQVAGRLVGGNHAVGKRLGVPADDRERRLEVMGDVGDELLALQSRRAQTVHEVGKVVIGAHELARDLLGGGDLASAPVRLDRPVQRTRRTPHQARKPPGSHDRGDQPGRNRQQRDTPRIVHHALIGGIAHQRGGQHQRAQVAVSRLIIEPLDGHPRIVHALDEVEFATAERGPAREKVAVQNVQVGIEQRLRVDALVGGIHEHVGASVCIAGLYEHVVLGGRAHHDAIARLSIDLLGKHLVEQALPIIVDERQVARPDLFGGDIVGGVQPRPVAVEHRDTARGELGIPQRAEPVMLEIPLVCKNRLHGRKGGRQQELAGSPHREGDSTQHERVGREHGQAANGQAARRNAQRAGKRSVLHPASPGSTPDAPAFLTHRAGTPSRARS